MIRAWTYEHDDTSMQHDETIMHQLTLLGLPCNQHMHNLTITDITWSSQDPIKLGINNTVVIIHDHKELDLYPWFSHNTTNVQQLGILDTTVVLSRSHKDQPTSLIIEPWLLLSTFLLLLLTHSVTDNELGPYLRARLSIHLNTHSAEVSTLYPHHRSHGLALPFRWTNGILTKLICCHDTLPATLTNSPLG